MCRIDAPRPGDRCSALKPSDGSVALDHARRHAKAHVFDVDHTLTARSTGTGFARAGLERGIFRVRDLVTLPLLYLRYRYGNLDIRDLTREVRSLAGYRRLELAEVAEYAFRSYGIRELLPGAIDHLLACRAMGVPVILASTSLMVVLEPYARYLELVDIVSSRLEFLDGKSTGRIVGRPCYAQEKALRMIARLSELSIDPRNAAFYSDSYHDLPSLRAVGYPFAVNPDRRLRRHAKATGRPIVSWPAGRSTDPMRHRPR